MDWFDDFVAEAKRKSGCYEETKRKTTHICSRCGEYFNHKPLGRNSKKHSARGKKFCSSNCFTAASYAPRFK